MGALWASRPQTAALVGCTMRSQLLCPGPFLGEATAPRAAHLAAALSRACHYHRCELAPTAGGMKFQAAGMGRSGSFPSQSLAACRSATWVFRMNSVSLWISRATPNSGAQ